MGDVCVVWKIRHVRREIFFLLYVHFFLIKENKVGGGERQSKEGFQEDRERQREKVKMVICPGPTAIKPGGRNWFLDDRRASLPRKVLSFPQQEVRREG